MSMIITIIFTVGWLKIEQAPDTVLEIRIGAKVSIIEKVANSEQSRFDFEWNELDFNDWKEFESVDLIVRCTQGDFKIYLNGKLVKTLASENWHPATGELPKPEKIRVDPQGTTKFTKLQWTFSKDFFPHIGSSFLMETLSPLSGGITFYLYYILSGSKISLKKQIMV